MAKRKKRAATSRSSRKKRTPVKRRAPAKRRTTAKRRAAAKRRTASKRRTVAKRRTSAKRHHPATKRRPTSGVRFLLNADRWNGQCTPKSHRSKLRRKGCRADRHHRKIQSPLTRNSSAFRAVGFPIMPYPPIIRKLCERRTEIFARKRPQLFLCAAMIRAAKSCWSPGWSPDRGRPYCNCRRSL